MSAIAQLGDKRNAENSSYVDLLDGVYSYGVYPTRAQRGSSRDERTNELDAFAR